MTKKAGVGHSIADQYRGLDIRDRTVLITTTAAFLLGFLPAYSVSALGMTQTTSLYDVWHGKFFFLTSLSTVSLLLSPFLRHQLLGKLTPDGRAMTIPALTAVSLIFGPVFSLVSPPEAFAGIRDAAEQTEGLISGGSTFWSILTLIACAAAAGLAFSRWRESAAAS